MSTALSDTRGPADLEPSYEVDDVQSRRCKRSFDCFLTTDDGISSKRYMYRTYYLGTCRYLALTWRRRRRRNLEIDSRKSQQ